MPTLLIALMLAGGPKVTVDKGWGGAFTHSTSNPALFAKELLGKTHVIEGIYRGEQRAHWSCYEDRPVITASGALTLADGSTLGLIPLASQLPIPKDHVVQIEGTFKELPCAKYPKTKVLYFEPGRILDKRDFASAKKLVSRYHRKHAESHDAKLLEVRHPGPSLTEGKEFHVAYDVPTRRLALTTSASRPLAWHAIADYVLDPTWKRIEEIHLHSFFQGE